MYNFNTATASQADNSYKYKNTKKKIFNYDAS